MENPNKEDLFLSSASIDYVSLSEIVRISLGYKKIAPDSDQEYLEALHFLNYLLDKYGARLKCYIGPGVKLINKEPRELIAWLKNKWYTGKYNEIDYSIWFELVSEETANNIT